MLKNLSLKAVGLIAWCIALQCAAFSQEISQVAGESKSIAERATQKAREGNLDEALELYRAALARTPEDIAVLRDYAVVLGWADQYTQAIPIIKKIMAIEADQPDWALREFARSYLFGDRTADALQLLEELVKRGDHTEQTLVRRALALRWLNRYEQAHVAYADILERYPDSAAGYSGLAHSQADQGRLGQALHTLDAAPSALQEQADIVHARIQILNWLGRHYEAQRLLASAPPALADRRDILQERIAAARWGGNPSGAMHDIKRLVSLYPDQSTRSLLGQLRTEYGYSLIPSFRFSKDSDGLVDQTAGSEASLHINPAHTLRMGYQYRWLDQHDVRTLVRYDVGWSGALTRRLTVYTAASSIDYRTFGLSQKVIGDASVMIAATDALKLGGGGGVIAMDAFQAVGKQITARFTFGEFVTNLGRNKLQSRYSRFAFSNDLNRDRWDTEFIRTILAKRAAGISAGFRSNLMWHDAWTPDFYSPSRLQSYVGTVQPSGHITRWMDFAGEIAAGFQSEPGTPWLHPLQASGKLMWHPSRHWIAVIEAGKSTSSVDRIFYGMHRYSRWSASAGIEVRFP